MFCELCQKILPPGSGGLSHFSGKKHLAKVEIQRRREDFSERSVFVTGFKLGTLEIQLMDYFSRFGHVSKIIPDKTKGQYAIVEFASKDTRDLVLAHKFHRLGNAKLKVKERTMKKAKTFDSSEVVDFPELGILHQTPLVVEQMVKLLETVSQTDEELQAKDQLCQTLESIFSDFYPGCSLKMYGSSASGYGFKGCDLDLHFTLPNTLVLGADVDPPSIEEVKKRVRTVRNLAAVGHLKFVQGLIKRYGPSCRHVLFINARCPIVRFVHGETEIQCDLSCSKGLSVHNTRLLRLYGELDKRTHLLIMTLRFWAKKRGLLGSGKKFTSYAFTLMIIFYLQTRQPPVAPPVEELARLAVEQRTVDDWDCTFCEDLTLIPKSQNQETEEELLKGFFHYLCNFDFTMNAMCTRRGCIIPKSELTHLQKPCAVAVQDPFELNHVVTQAVNGQHLVDFLENLDAALKICTRNSWGLHNIIVDNLQTSIVPANVTAETESVEIWLDPSVLVASFGELAHSDKEMRALWLEKICQMVVDILTKGLLFTCVDNGSVKGIKRRMSDQSEDLNPEKQQKLDQSEDLNPEKQQKLDHSDDLNPEQSSEIHSVKQNKEEEVSGGSQSGEGDTSSSCQENLLRTVRFKVFHPVWMGRKKASKGVILEEGATDCLQREESISKVLMEGPAPGEPLMEFKCSTYKVQRGPLTLLRVFFRCETESCKQFNTLVSFLKRYIPQMISTSFAMEMQVKNQTTASVSNK